MVKKETSFIDLKRVKIDDPFFSRVQDVVIHTMIPYQERVLHDEVSGIKKSHVIKNFRIAAGDEEGTYYGRVFQDSDLAKWLEAVAYSLTVEENPELEKRADDIIDLIGRVQQPDGYLDTYFIAEEPEHKWQNLTDCHEMYCAGHMTEAGVAYYQATGKTKLLDICCKLCDHIDRRFGREEGKVTGIPGHEEIELALLRLYEATGEDRYRRLATYFIDERGKDPEFFHKEAAVRGWSRTDYMDKQPSSYMQNHKPVREQDTVEGHAVRCMYLLTAAANLAAKNHDKALMAACRKMWDNMVERRMYITGGIGSNYYGEAFSIDYDLPNDTAYAETCAAVGVCFFAKQMLEADPDSRYADILEREIYNGTISGMQLDGTKFFYINQLEANPGMPAGAYGDEEYTPERIGWYDCACCPPNLARLMTSLGSYVWSSDENTIYSHLFVGGMASFETAGGVAISLKSEYPWKGMVNYTIEPKKDEAEFTLAIRYPGWCNRMQVMVNGIPISEAPRSDKGYWMISRKWQSGDTVSCEMEMEPERVYAHPMVRADVGCVAIRRGPIIYAFEGIDNGEKLQTLRIPKDARVEALPYNPELLEGIVPIRVSGCRKKILSETALYTGKSAEEETVTLQAIPYYAWCNRGLTHMRVWMPE